MPKGTYGRQSVMSGTAIIASPSVNLTVTSQPSSLRSDDGDTLGRLKASFPGVMATTAASMRYYMTLSERNVRCVDNTIHYDTDLHTHWWRTIDFVIRVGQAGIVLNADNYSSSHGELLTSQGSAYLTKPPSPFQNTWTPSATFRRQHLPRTFADAETLFVTRST